MRPPTYPKRDAPTARATSSSAAAGIQRRPATPPPASAANATASATAADEKSGSATSTSTPRSAARRAVSRRVVPTRRRDQRARWPRSGTGPGCPTAARGAASGWRRRPGRRCPGRKTALVASSAATSKAGAAWRSRRVPSRAVATPRRAPRPRPISCRTAKCAGAPAPATVECPDALATTASPSAPRPTDGTASNSDRQPPRPHPQNRTSRPAPTWRRSPKSE